LNSNLQKAVSDHYGNENLLEGIKKAVRAAGLKIDSLTVDDLSGVDEFHIGGRAATERILGNSKLSADHRILDIGCGLGGAARYLASRFGCQVDGQDLTKDFVDSGNTLSHWVGLQDKVRLHLSDGKQLPCPPSYYDFGYMFHVGMNVPDKAELFRQIHNCLKDGARFVIYDVMRESGDQDAKNDLSFPVPWTRSKKEDYSTTVESYKTALSSAGFTLQKETDHKKFAVEFFEKMFAMMTQDRQLGRPPRLSLRQIIQEDFQTKMKNMIEGLEKSIIRPVELVVIKGN